MCPDRPDEVTCWAWLLLYLVKELIVTGSCLAKRLLLRPPASREVCVSKVSTGYASCWRRLAKVMSVMSFSSISPLSLLLSVRIFWVSVGDFDTISSYSGVSLSVCYVYKYSVVWEFSGWAFRMLARFLWCVLLVRCDLLSAWGCKRSVCLLTTKLVVLFPPRSSFMLTIFWSCWTTPSWLKYASSPEGCPEGVYVEVIMFMYLSGGLWPIWALGARLWWARL